MREETLGWMIKGWMIKILLLTVYCEVNLMCLKRCVIFLKRYVTIALCIILNAIGRSPWTGPSQIFVYNQWVSVKLSKGMWWRTYYCLQTAAQEAERAPCET